MLACGGDFQAKEKKKNVVDPWIIWAIGIMMETIQQMQDRSPANLRYGARLLTMATLQQSLSRQLPPTWIVGGTLSYKLDFGSFA